MLSQVVSALVTATAVFSWLNRRYLHLPANVAMLLMGLSTAFALLAAEVAFPHRNITDPLADALGKVNFYDTVMHGMLAFLLFAGAITVNWKRLRSRAPVVALLATLGVFLSALLVATISWLGAKAFGLPLEFSWCFVFGALIAPTDPVAALAALKYTSLPEHLEIEITGEALFNDGVAVVLFTLALQFAVSKSGDFGASQAVLLLLREAGGGLLLGLVAGYLTFHALNTVNDYADEILFSLALVMATYSLAVELHISGPISVVVAGILIGNRGAPVAMSEHTRSHFFSFWRLVEYLLNGVLFTLLGLEVIILHLGWGVILTGMTAIPVVLAGRYVAVGASIRALGPWLDFDGGTSVILTWSSIRGAISAALALALPQSEARPYILAGTYAVIVFSVIIQTMTLPGVVKRIVEVEKPDADG